MLSRLHKIVKNNNVRRNYSQLKESLKDLIPIKQKELQSVKQKSSETIDKVTIGQTIGGMRGIKSMLWDISLLDSEEGIKFHNKTINDLRENLPKSVYQEPMAESLLWFLITGKEPTLEESLNLSKELHEKGRLSQDIKNNIINLPRHMHPMTKLSTSILMLQQDSRFVKRYNNGMSKNEYWEDTYEDAIDIIAKLPEICSLIYTSSYDKDKVDYNSNIDYTSNFCNMMGFPNAEFHELMRLYILIHCDHEGGNASAHTCRLVGSTLSDPYLSYSASMNALAGPLHGLANQEVLKWIIHIKKKLNLRGKYITKESLKEIVWETLENGQVIPGYGHAVLRNTDPRFLCQRDFALQHLPNDELFNLVNLLYEIVPEILTEHGKTKNPYPNVDAHSGVLLNYYDMKEYEFYTVLFGMSRAFGVLSQLIWDRALGLPLERPKSLTIQCLQNQIESSNTILK